MDSEKYVKVQQMVNAGESPNDEGPFYHHSWWESYKGSIKGKLGGAVIGALMGAIIGGAVAATMAIAGITTGIGIGAAFLAVTAGGLLYGAHEFSDIGKIDGAVSSGLEQADAREAIRFAALEKKLDGLTKALKSKGIADAALPPANGEAAGLENYRTTHYAQLKPDSKNRYVFWKVAAIGLAVGALAGALLGIGGADSAAAHLFEAVGLHIGTGAGLTAVSAITFGLFGASFGINRDVFRRIFDTTDLWAKGMLSHKKVAEEQVEAGKMIEAAAKKKNGKKNGKTESPAVATAVLPESPEAGIDYPQSSTYHRDKVLAAAEKALLSFDHTRATPQ